MEQGIVKRGSVALLLSFAILSEFIGLIMVLGYDMDGSMAVNDMDMEMLWFFFSNVFNPAVLLFLIALLIKPFCPRSVFSKLALVYFIVAAIITITTLTYGGKNLLFL